MSWGNKLLFAFIGFAVLMGTLIYKCTQENFELVSTDYYSEELRYQDKIDGANNANKLSDVTISQSESELVLQLPKEQVGLAISGQLWFYCPTNAASDKKMPLKVNENGEMIIRKADLDKTRYQLKTSWEAGTEKFYKEVTISID